MKIFDRVYSHFVLIRTDCEIIFINDSSINNLLYSQIASSSLHFGEKSSIDEFYEEILFIKNANEGIFVSNHEAMYSNFQNNLDIKSSGCQLYLDLFIGC